jgi:Cu+-exporting ATPase
VGIDDFFAEVRPDEKSMKIRSIQAEGKRVGMVGDGINDAPALAQADTGFAIGTGTDVAIETGDVLLSGGSLDGIPRAIGVSRKTMRTIRQNLALAFVYNTVLIPVAAGVLAPVAGLPEFLRQLHPHPGGAGHGAEQHFGGLQQFAALPRQAQVTLSEG